MKTLTFPIAALLLTASAYCQVDRSDDLYKAINTSDSVLFDIGFNTCNSETLEKSVSEEFTFYHDQSGITESKKAFIESVQNELCKLPYRAIRTLNDSSMRVYPLKQNDTIYGAIQNGEHSFSAIEADNQKYLTSVARFTHVWVLLNGQWKLRSVLSYDHQDVEKKDSENGLFIDSQVTNNWLAQKNIPSVAIGYIEDGQIIQTSVFGELEDGKAAPLNTIWNVASLTKPIIALITLKLVDKGLWELDAPISTYFIDPDLADDPRNALLNSTTILSHQTGLPNWRGDTQDGKLKFEFAPGEQYQYSGEAYEMLRKALEAKFEKDIEELAQELIFDPLAMVNTSFVWKEPFDEQPYAKWYKAEGELYDYQKFFEANGADNLLTTIEDYSRFVHYVLNGAGLSSGLQKEMSADQVRVNDFKHFGLGWWVDERINEKKDYALAHGGDDIGVHCIAFILPNTQKGLIIFTNSDNGTDTYMDIVNHYLGKDAKGIFNAEMN